MESIHHIALRAEWEAGKKDPRGYAPAGFASEGFIHCSFATQVSESLRKHFRGKKDLCLLTIDPERLRCPLVVEGTSADRLFPHIYGRLDEAAVTSVEPVLAPE